MSEVWVLLPGYNVAPHLAGLVPRIRVALPTSPLLLVDDGSIDGTAEVARGLGLRVLQHERNRGKGVALRTGFALACSEGAAAVLTLDADGQHAPEEAPRFVRAWQAGAQVVVGDRMDATADMPWLRLQTNRFTSSVISRLAGTPIPDSQNGYRLFDAVVLRSIELESERYDLESEVLIKAGRMGFTIASVPISTIYGDQVSSIHPVQDTLRFVRLVTRAQRWRREAELAARTTLAR